MARMQENSGGLLRGPKTSSFQDGFCSALTMSSKESPVGELRMALSGRACLLLPNKSLGSCAGNTIYIFTY